MTPFTGAEIMNNFTPRNNYRNITRVCVDHTQLLHMARMCTLSSFVHSFVLLSFILIVQSGPGGTFSPSSKSPPISIELRNATCTRSRTNTPPSPRLVSHSQRWPSSSFALLVSDISSAPAHAELIVAHRRNDTTSARLFSPTLSRQLQCRR